MNFDLAEELSTLLLNNNVEEAIKLAEGKLLEYPETDFHKIIGKDLKHLTEDLTEYIDAFYRDSKDKMDVKSIYSEMNGFTINYDLWFIDLFAFAEYGGLDDLNWLADFEVASDDSMVISGFEDLQAVYQDYMENEKWKDKNLAKACEICELLIILRLQELFKAVGKAALDRELPYKDIPLLVTAHDYDMIYQVKI